MSNYLLKWLYQITLTPFVYEVAHYSALLPKFVSIKRLIFANLVGVKW